MNRKLAEKAKVQEGLERKTLVQERVLARGEAKYQERIEDIRVLKMEMKRLKQEEVILNKNTQNMEEMKKEVIQSTLHIVNTICSSILFTI